MNKQQILEAAQATHEGTRSFPEIVAALLSAGVEYYLVDYVQRQTTFFSANGEVVTAPIDFNDLPAVAAEFDGPALRAAIRDSQLNGQKYHDFSKRATAAGVQAYFAFLRGQRVTYLGRTGEQHTEWFPGAAPRNVPKAT